MLCLFCNFFFCFGAIFDVFPWHSPKVTNPVNSVGASFPLDESQNVLLGVGPVVEGSDGHRSSVFQIFLVGGKFERNLTDIFNVEVAALLSPLGRVTIGHDNDGVSAGWYCDKVRRGSRSPTHVHVWSFVVT